MLRSVLAIVAGFVTIAVLSISADAAMHGLGVFPADRAAMSDGHFGLATLYRTVFTLLGGALTGLLSARTDQRDVRILAGIGFLAGLAGVAAWFATPGLGPLWYAAAIPVTGAIATLLGGQMVQRLR